MFSKSHRNRADAAEAQLANAMAYIADLEARTRLLGIERSGRLNRFTFARGGEIHVIETMGTWDDEVELWKEWLL